MRDLLVIIPAYDAGRTIGTVIEGIREALSTVQCAYDILVVDDGSNDNTASIAQKHDTQIHRHDANRGKGAALRTGIAHAVAQGYSWLLTIDADLQHPPALIPRFLHQAGNGRADLVIGTRSIQGSQMPLHRKLSNRLTSWLIFVKTGLRLQDTQSGYRLIRTGALQTIELKTKHYETESEILIRLARRGAIVETVPIDTVYGHETSHIRHTRDTWRFIRMYLTT